MAQRRPTILIALADRVRAEELAAFLAEEGRMRPVLAGEEGAAECRFDLALTDGSPIDAAVPHVLLGDDVDRSGTRLGHLLPGASDSAVAAALRLAAEGYRTLPAEGVSPSYASPDPRHGDRRAGGRPVSSSLTPREREVLMLLAEGASNKVIARRLEISVHTAKFHVAAILEKLGAVNRTDAIATAMREGFVLV